MHLRTPILTHADKLPFEESKVFSVRQTDRGTDSGNLKQTKDSVRRLMKAEDFQLRSLMQTNGIQALKEVVIRSTNLGASDHAEAAFLAGASNLETNE